MMKKYTRFLCFMLFMIAGQTFQTAQALELFAAPEKQPADYVRATIQASSSLPRWTVLNDLYTRNQFEPFWKSFDDTDHQAMAQFLRAMENYAVYHGVTIPQHDVDMITPLLNQPTTENNAKIEILTTDLVLSMAEDLDGGRVNLKQIYPGWPFDGQKKVNTEGLLASIKSGGVEAYFKSMMPSDPDYMKLADALMQYRLLAAKGPWPMIPPGPSLKIGMSDPRVVKVRERFAFVDEAPVEEITSPLYTEALAERVKRFQHEMGLDVDGSIGAKTLAALNVPAASRVDTLLANMERLRHMDGGKPAYYASVNIADMTVKVFQDGQVIYASRVVAGRPDRKTPFISSEIRSVIFNPSWHVPSKIARQDILPKLRKDPHYLEKMGMILVGGNAEDPHGKAVDWDRMSPGDFDYQIRQAPGEANALGRIKFDFDNDFAVYMHGTPHQELFAKADRHQSSGCVRLEDPVAFARVVLESNDGGWDTPKIQAAIDDQKTRWMQVTKRLPIFFVYQTAFYDEALQRVVFRADDYGYDRLLIQALK